MHEEDEDLLSLGWTDLSSYSWSLSDSDSDSDHQVSSLQSDIMSRCSLRLNDRVLNRSLPLSSASYSAGLGSRRSSRSLKLHPPSISCSESLLQTSVHSDASLLSSLLDESSIQEATMVDSFWGLDHDFDTRESTVIEDQRSVMADVTMTGSGDSGSKPSVQTLSRVYCKDCELESDQKEAVNTYSSSKYTSCSSCSSVFTPTGTSSETETSTIYCRDRSRRTRTARSGRCGAMKESKPMEIHPNGALCRTAGDVFRWLQQRWNHVTTNFCFSRLPLRLVVVLLPLLLLLFTLCWFSPAGLRSEWRTDVSPQSQSEEGAVEEPKEVQVYEEPPVSRPLEAETLTGEEDSEVEDMDSERLVRLEQRLAALWQRVEAGGRRAEQRHREVLQLYTDLQLHHHHHHPPEQQSDAVESWINNLMDQQLSQLNTRLDEERLQREQIRMQDLVQQQSQTSRLDQLELQLQTLAAKSEEVHWRQDAPSTSTLPAAVSAGVDPQSHDALLTEVSRLEAALEDVRRDVAILSSSQDGCRQLAAAQQTLSEQVSSQLRDQLRDQLQEQLRSLLFGNQLMEGGAGVLPESLLLWLSQRYVSSADLQVALSSLELSILHNISQQLHQHHGSQPAREDAMTTEDVQTLVQEALRLFSQDRTGLADYALESGGGSILSTRCSETYETKAALLSLFGLPLWYFSQSPRAVIQPDVHPGNCWAFRGSTGFLVIRLSMRILPSAFSLEHIPKALAPSRTLLSAPRDFSVYGLEDESQEKGKLLGSYRYDEDGEALQTFSVTEENDEAFQIIEVQVLSNWGHQEYTCMYRFRVHGTPSDV